MNLFDKIESHYQQKVPFVVYNKPDKTEVIGLFQNDNCTYLTVHFNEKGFVFASFDGKNNVLIPEENSKIFIETFNFSTIQKKDDIVFKEDIEEKISHKILVQKGIDAIQNKLFDKVVLSRKETISYLNFDLIETFKNLLNQYPSAFTYCFFHPQTGLWMGAFSEQLLKIDGVVFSTMSLAGTQKIDGAKEIIWQKKEQEEQQIVTDYIVNELNTAINNLEVSSPYTIKAGSLLHLKTDIIGSLNENHNLKNILQILHPTPAVCGFPKESAKKFIHENENYNREFYAGFLGELNKDFDTNENKTDLFVNLRCMKIEANTINFYAGGGITKDSIPEKEWEETVNKTNTMKSCIL
jgi:isochorismate synthase